MLMENLTEETDEVTFTQGLYLAALRIWHLNVRGTSRRNGNAVATVIIIYTFLYAS